MADRRSGVRSHAAFETGPLAASDWGADAAFLGGGLLRVEITLPESATVRRARAYVAAPGCHVLEVNGRSPPINALKAPAEGSAIRIQLGEWLDGTSGKPATRGTVQTGDHTLAAARAGAALETMFVWHGFQFALVTRTGDNPFSGELGDITGLEIHTDVESVSSIRFGGTDGKESCTSAALLNRISDMARASMISNVAAYIQQTAPPPKSADISQRVPYAYGKC